MGDASALLECLDTRVQDHRFLRPASESARVGRWAALRRSAAGPEGRTANFRLRARCSASDQTALVGSGLLTLGAASAQTAHDGSRRIVWMIKRIRSLIEWRSG
jgi:hypothetical protein